MINLTSDGSAVRVWEQRCSNLQMTIWVTEVNFITATVLEHIIFRLTRFAVSYLRTARRFGIRTPYYTYDHLAMYRSVVY